MKLTSSAVKEGRQIDKKYTVEGEDVSPDLAWTDTPTGTQSLALICENPDAPSPRKPAASPWVHWILFNIPADLSGLPSGVEQTLELDSIPGTRHGVNSWPDDNVGYRGPAPPPGSGRHRYFFRLYALDSVLGLEAGATKRRLLDKMSGHVLAECQLMATFER